MLLEIKNPNDGKKYRLADKIRIRVSSVDEVFSRINFELEDKFDNYKNSI
jgi:exoribonuclease R